MSYIDNIGLYISDIAHVNIHHQTHFYKTWLYTYHLYTKKQKEEHITNIDTTNPNHDICQNKSIIKPSDLPLPQMSFLFCTTVDCSTVHCT